MEIVNAQKFDEVIKNGVVLVDFFANWCGPCKMLSPVLEGLSKEMPNVGFYKVDVDVEQRLAGRYGIQAIPNMVIFKDGKAVDQITGFTSKGDIQNRLNKYL